MSEAVVLLEKSEKIAVVTLSRPEKLNALNRELRHEFCRTMQNLRTDPEVGCVIITGAGRVLRRTRSERTQQRVAGGCGQR